MNTAITTATVATASLAALRPALMGWKAYTKVARYNLDDMRAYTAKVAEIREAGNVEPLSPDNVDAVLAQVRADKAPAAKAPKAPKAPKAQAAEGDVAPSHKDEADRTPRAATVAKLKAAITQGAKQQNGDVLVTESVFEANGCGRMARIPAWRWNGGAAGKAAEAAGYTGRKVKEGVVFTKAAGK